VYGLYEKNTIFEKKKRQNLDNAKACFAYDKRSSVHGTFNRRNNQSIMTFKNKFSPKYLTIVTSTFLFACGQSNSSKSVSQAENIRSNLQGLTIDNFSTFPPEIDGCSCYFSNDSTEFKKGEYVYMNDYAQTSFLKINGILTKFTQIDFKEIDSLNVKAIYKSDNYEMTIESKDGIQNGDETWLKTGTIKLSNKKGQTITKKFYGECGC
jgi:hypothetical protein